MSLRARFEHAIGLGPSDEPRAVTVGARAATVVKPVVSTPGARVRITRDGWSAELARVILTLHRRGIPFQLDDGPNALHVDGRPVTPLELSKMRLP